MYQFVTLICALIVSPSLFAQTTLNIPVSADTYISKAYPDTNNGTKPFLSVDNSPQKDILLKFNVSGIGSSTVQSAKIRLMPARSNSSGGDFRGALGNNWTETGVTWSNAPAAGSSVFARQGPVVKGQAVDADVTSIIRADGTFSFRISNSVADGTDYDYSSKEAGTSLQPRLILVVDSGLATTTPEPTPTPTPTPAPTPISAVSCLSQSGPLVTLSGANSTPYFRFDLSASTKVDARNASWTGKETQFLKIGGGDNICASGGKIQGTFDPLTTPWTTYHDSYAFVIYGNNMTVENFRVDNYGDAFNVRNDATTGSNFRISNVHVSNNHDDCVQNDSMKSGAIYDSLFDGCYNFYSSRAYGSGPNNLVRIENNVVRSQGFPTYYGGEAADKNDPSQYENGGFFKIDEFDKAPKLAIHNNVFRADKDSRGWIPFLPNVLSVASCSNNVIVWLGTGPFPEKIPASLASCFKIVTDKSVWDNAVANWKATHGY